MILLAVFLVCCLLTGANCYTTDLQAVVDTEVTNRSETAYQALLLYKGAPFCGGTIIDEKHVLTSAYCCFPQSNLLVKASELSVVVGSLFLYDTTVVKDVTTVIIHEDYDPRTLDNDIALLRISGSFDKTTDISPINLTTEHLNSGTCRVSGWGFRAEYIQTVNKNLVYVDVPIIDWNVCNEPYSRADEPIGENAICAGFLGKDSCYGDYGGPLVCLGKLTGIVSYRADCTLVNYPGVYTEVAKYAKWIELSKFKSSADKSRQSFVTVYLLFIIVCSSKWL